MAPEPPADAGWTEEQRRLLDHERFQAEVERMRRGSGRSGGDGGKPAWQRFLESTGGAALITVLLGGILGNWIAGQFEAARAENERRALTHEKYLAARLATVQPLLERVGGTVRASEDLITLTRPDWEPSPARFPDPTERQATLDKRREIREAYNQADADWRSEKDSLGYLLAYYHGGSSEVSTAWSTLSTALTAYVDCARGWYVDHTGRFTEEAVDACSDERSTVDASMRDLIALMGAVEPSPPGAAP